MITQDELQKISQLAKEDMASCEKYCRELIDRSINEITQDPIKQTRLRQVQFRIDNELRKYKNPLSRMEAMRSLLIEGIFKLQQAIKDPNSLLTSDKPAKVLPFKQKE